MKKFLSITALLLFIVSCQKGTPESEVPTSPNDSSTNSGVVIKANAACDYTFNETALLNSGWSKAFEDEFTTDLNKWEVLTGRAFKDELHYYQAPNLKLTDGALQVIAKKETIIDSANATLKTFNYTSGGIIGRTEFSADATTPKVRFSARIRLPNGFGMTPAFFSFGSLWPTQGQINILTARSEEPKQYRTEYYYGTKVNENLVRDAISNITANMDLTSCYHVYEVEWSQNALTYFLDGQVIEKKTSGGYVSALFGKKQRLELNLTIKTPFFYRAQIQVGTMYVDWIKVFTSK